MSDWREIQAAKAAEAAAERAATAIAEAIAPFPPAARARLFARAMVRLDRRRRRDGILQFLTEHPGATVQEVAKAVYGADTHSGCSRARALLHNLKGMEKVREVGEGARSQWEAVLSGATARKPRGSTR